MRNFMWIVASVMLAGATVPANAHHSLAMFDATREVQIEGTVREFQWTNPHTWLQVMVRNSDGTETEWSLEGGSVNMMARQGWKRNTFVAGEKLTVKLKPLKDGRPGGQLVTATKSDGTVVKWVLGPSTTN